MNRYQLSKYHPSIPSPWSSEWTSYSDIGKRFNGDLLTEEKYLAVEEKFCKCLCEIAECILEDHFLISGLENYKKTKWKDGAIVTLNNFSFVIKDCLREKCWCKLVSKNLIISFGYDYYVHIETTLAEEELVAIVNKYGLYLRRVCFE